MARIKAVGFDFDDTLIVSEKEKSTIFEEVFYRRYGIKKGIKRAYEGLRGKAGREEKIRVIIRKLLKREPTSKEVREVSYAFGKGYEFKLAHCPLIECTNMLKELKEQVKFTFLLSLENKKEVVNIARHCNIAKYFDEILGGPKPKTENLRHVLENHHLNPEETIYVGDSEGDIMKSKQLDIIPIGISRKFKYRKLLKELGAYFTFSSVCEIPFKAIIKGDKV